MAEAVYVLCALLSVTCALLLMRQHRMTPSHLLFWSFLCFVALAVNNVFLVADLVVFPMIDLDGQYWRSIIGAAAGSLLLFGLIWELT